MRHKNATWNLEESPVWEGVQTAVLMDLRDELQALVTLFRSLPCALAVLRRIDRAIRAARRCPKHPRYTATRKPRVACAGCHRYYKAVWK